MLALTILLALITGIFGLAWEYEDWVEMFVLPMVVATGAAVIITCGWILCAIYGSVSIQSASSEIEILEERNVEIETTLQVIIEQREGYDMGVHEKITPEIVLAYPELSSNELVKQYAETYVANKNEVTDIKLSVARNKVIIKNLFWFF